MKKSLIAMGCLATMLSAGMMLAQDKATDKGKTKAKAGDAAKGKMTFEENCSVCHNSDSEDAKIGPGLKGLTKHAKIVNGEPMNDANLAKFLNEGGNGMPAFADILTAPQKADILAFLKSL